MALTKVQTELLGAGSVIQVVQGSYAVSTGTTSSSYVSSGLSLSITPKFSTSKVLILFNGSCYTSGSGTGQVSIFRGATNLSGSATGFVEFVGTSNVMPIGMSYLDFPATTSSTTYNINFKSAGGTVYLAPDNFPSYITLMEIAQ